MKSVLDICYSTFSHLLLVDLSDCRYCLMMMFGIWDHSFSDYMLCICCLGQWYITRRIFCTNMQSFIFMLVSNIIKKAFTAFKKM